MVKRKSFLLGYGFLALVVVLTLGLVNLVKPAEAAASKSIVGAWYVDTIGAPFAPHGITFHVDNTLDLTNPDAAEATNSSSAGMGAWEAKQDTVRGSFFEVNASKTTFQFTTLLVVRFMVKVSGNTFDGPATATYYDGNRNIIAGPFPATLKGQRFGVDGPVPDPVG